MTTQTIGQTDGGFDLVAAFRAAAPESRDRKFWITLAVALALHSLILISLIQSPPRQMGNPNSPSDAVAVSFVTEAELRDASAGSDGGPSTPPPGAPPVEQPPPPQPQAQPSPPTPPQPQAQPQPETPPVPPQPKAEATPAEPAPPPAEKAETLAKAEEPVAAEPPPQAESTEPAIAVPKEKPEPKPPVEAKSKPEKPVQDPKDLAKDLPDLLELPDPAKTARPPQKQQPAQKQQKQAMRAPDMTLPGQQKTMMQSFDGRSAGIERPAGITRSGANDDFARGVVRALRQTMPQMNALGRLTVRIIINQNGNIESVEVLARSENTDLNRAVVFSTKQASFPFPPNGATLDDRTFTITYIYH